MPILLPQAATLASSEAVSGDAPEAGATNASGPVCCEMSARSRFG